MEDLLEILYKYSIHFGDEYIHDRDSSVKNSDVFFKLFDIQQNTFNFQKHKDSIDIFITNHNYPKNKLNINRVVLFELYISNIFTNYQNAYLDKEEIDFSKLIIDTFQKYFINIQDLKINKDVMNTHNHLLICYKNRVNRIKKCNYHQIINRAIIINNLLK